MEATNRNILSVTSYCGFMMLSFDTIKDSVFVSF